MPFYVMPSPRRQRISLIYVDDILRVMPRFSSRYALSVDTRGVLWRYYVML